MKAFRELKKVVPSGTKYISVRLSSSNKNEDKNSSDIPLKTAILFSREGDNGHSVVNNLPLPKNNRLFEAVGNTDELLCYLGVARENAISKKHPYIDQLTRIQTMLVDIVLAINKQCNNEVFPPQNTKELEEWIVQYSKDLTPAEPYILPGGGKVATSLHVARSVCRRAERSVIPLVMDGCLDKEIQIYFNRLADLLFTWARYAAKRDERSESVYTPKSEAKNISEDTSDSQKNHSKPS